MRVFLSLADSVVWVGVFQQSFKIGLICVFLTNPSHKNCFNVVYEKKMRFPLTHKHTQFCV